MENITNYPNGSWTRVVYNDSGCVILYENSNGYCESFEYDEHNRVCVHKKSFGYWCQSTRVEFGTIVRYENSAGK